MRHIFFILLILSVSPGFAQSPAAARTPEAPSGLSVLGTRTWVRLSWQDNATTEKGYRVYWSTVHRKPAVPGAMLPANATCYYIHPVTPLTTYYVWVDAYNASGSSNAVMSKVKALKTWSLDTAEVNHISIPSSLAVPAGMQLFWQDEFNDAFLNRNKWSTNYYSTVDFYEGTNLSALNGDSLAQPAIEMTGHSIKLMVSDSMPAKAYWPARKVSSIQTYDWHSNECYLDNRRGGYYEVRVRRSNTPKEIKGLNMAYWFDSPGPNLTYWMEQGNALNGVSGVRPHGQVFEIDVFEEDGDVATDWYTPFTLHGHVAANGSFKGHLDTYNAPLKSQDDWVTHGLLWTPAGLRYYINGVLQKSWNDPANNMAPNHTMNVLLGAYYGWTAGMTNHAVLEVDYIRGYQWPVVDGNELPNSGFEYGILFPWTGTAHLSTDVKRTGKAGAVLGAGEILEQYVFVDNSSQYQLQYWSRGSGTLRVQAENLAQVTGIVQTTDSKNSVAGAPFAMDSIDFATGREYGDHMKTVRIRFTNTGQGTIVLDDIALRKKGSIVLRKDGFAVQRKDGFAEHNSGANK